MIESWYPIAKSLHVFSMSSAFVLIVIGELLLLNGGYRQSAPRLYHWSRRLAGISDPLSLLGLAAGIATALIGGWSLLTPWLVLAYLLIILTFVLGGVFVMPWKRRVQAVIDHPERVAADKLQGLLRERQAIIGRWLILMVFVGILLVMRLKPAFGSVETAASATSNPVSEVSVVSSPVDVAYTLQTVMGGSPGLAFAGVNSGIDGMVNPTLTAVVGDDVTITLVNSHAMPHDLVLEGLGVATEQLSSAGQQSTIRFTVTTAGDYVYYCSFPGHRAAGMWGILRVVTVS